MNTKKQPAHKKVFKRKVPETRSFKQKTLKKKTFEEKPFEVLVEFVDKKGVVHKATKKNITQILKDVLYDVIPLSVNIKEQTIKLLQKNEPS